MSSPADTSAKEGKADVEPKPEKTPGEDQAEPQPRYQLDHGKKFYLDSTNFPDHRVNVGADGREVNMRKNDNTGDDGKGNAFIVRPSTLDEDAIRLELVDDESEEGTGKFLRHANYVCWVDEDDQGNDLLQKDSTFFPEQSKHHPGAVQFRSINFPSMFLGHGQFRLRLREFDGQGRNPKDNAWMVNDFAEGAFEKGEGEEELEEEKKKEAGKEDKDENVSTAGGEGALAVSASGERDIPINDTIEPQEATEVDEGDAGEEEGVSGEGQSEEISGLAASSTRPAAAVGDDNSSEGIDDHPEGSLVWSGENGSDDGEEHDHMGMWTDKKDKIEVYCEGMDPEADEETHPVNRFSMIVPEGITAGLRLEDIDGKGHTAVVPEGYGPGDEIILVMPAPLRSGELPLPNRNCFFAYAPPVLGGLDAKRYYEGDIEEMGKGNLRFTRDSDNSIIKNADVDSIVSLKRTKLRVRDACVAYRSAEEEGLAEGDIIKIEMKKDSALIFVDFSHAYKTHKEREKLYKSSVKDLIAMHHDSKIDILGLDPAFVFKKIPFSRHGGDADDQDGNKDVKIEYEPDTGLPPYHARTPGRLCAATFGCINKEADPPEKHLSSRRAILNRDSQSVRDLNPATDKYEYYDFCSSVVPFYHFPFMNWFCPANQVAETSFLDKYGFGVLAYFKLVKSLMVVFGLMTLITVPSVMIYSFADITPAEEAYYLGVTGGTSTLAYATVASLTEPKLLCGEALETESFKLQCPESYTMSGVVAYYGQPSGNCACPTFNQPSTSLGSVGSCRSDTLVANDGDTSCLPAADGNTYGCIPDTDRFDNICCAYNYYLTTDEDTGKETFKPDLTSMDLAPNYECNSKTAQYIATALCEGENSCEFTINHGNSIDFKYADLIELGDYSNICDSIEVVNSVQYCRTKLSSGGDFSGCDYSGMYPTWNFSTNTNTTADYRLIAEAYCTVSDIDVLGTVYTTRDLTFLNAVLGALAIFVYLVAVSIIRSEQSKAVEQLEGNTVQASDYTVQLYTLPKGAKDRNVKSDSEAIKKSIKDFFESQLFDEKDGAPISVADVNLATICDDYLRKCIARGAACDVVDKTLAKIQSSIRRKVWDPESAPSKKLQQDLKRGVLEFEVANESCAKLSEEAESSPYCAYVTFEFEDSFVKCLKKYPNVSIFTPFSQFHEDKLDGHTVYLEPAPLPEEIVWENLATTPLSRVIRVMITTILVFLLLAVSYAMIYQARYTGEQYSSSVVQIDCSLYEVNTNVGMNPSNYTTNTIGYYDVLQDTYPKHYYLSGNNSDWGQRGYARCFCQEVLYQAYLEGDEDPTQTMTSYVFKHPETDEDVLLCDSSTSAISVFFATFATIIVVGVNMSLAILLKSIVKFEHHQTKTGELLSQCFKLFLAQYINTAWLTQVISGDLDAAGGSIAEISFYFPGNKSIKFGTFTGSIDDYNETWYFSVGSSLMLTMFIFSAGQLPPQYIKVFQQKMSRLWDRRWTFRKGYTHKDTQDELDAMYLGPPMPIEQKYAYLLTLIFVDLTYSATLPLMNFITLLNLIIFYVSDKYTLLYFYQKPPVINTALPQLVVNALIGAAFIHLGNGMWMFGNEAFTSPDISTDYTPVVENGITYLVGAASYDEDISYIDRAFAYNSLPYLVVFLLFGALMAVRFAETIVMDVLGVRTVLYALANLFQKNCPAFNCFGNFEPEFENIPPYFEAIPLLTLKQRVMEHTLEEEIEHKYVEYIAKEEEDKALLGDSFTVDKAATMRYRRSTIHFEHNRRASLLRSALSDTSEAVNLDDVDRFHDTQSFVQHNKEEYEKYMLGYKKTDVETVHDSRYDAVDTFDDEDKEGDDAYFEDEDNTGTKKLHHDRSALPNRNCPVVYFPENDNDEGNYYEGTYLQYQEPDLTSDRVMTKFTFLKHFVDEDMLKNAVPIENVEPQRLFLLHKGKRGAFAAGEDVLCYTDKDADAMVAGECLKIDKQQHSVDVALTVGGLTVTVPTKWVYKKESLNTNRVGKFTEDDGIDCVGENEVYTGKIVHGLPHGRGKFVYSPDDLDGRVSYEGMWHKGQYHGHGKIEYTTGDTYEGDWKERQRDGIGLFFDAKDGSTYNGNWEQDGKHGRGKLLQKDGSILLGDWVRDEPQAKSMMTFPKGQQPDQVECGECGPRYTPSGDPTPRDCCGRPKCDCSKHHHIHVPCCTWLCNICEDKSNFAEMAEEEGDVEMATSPSNRVKGDPSSKRSSKKLPVSTKEDAAGDTDEPKAAEAEAKFLLGHESYNMDTIPEYRQRFGLSKTHMARRAPDDWILSSTNLPHVHDDAQIRRILSKAEPYRLRKPIRGDDGKPTGKYNWVIPKHSVMLQRLCKICGGGADSCNKTSCCECLAEPNDEGDQPKWECFMC